MPNLESLQELYGIADHVLFLRGHGDMPFVQLRQGSATTEVYLQGAHITSYKPDGHTDLLWLSSQAFFQKNKAIRGGIPICWPWFGPHHSDPKLPQHGFARTSEFSVSSSDLSDGEARLLLALDPVPVSMQSGAGESLRLEFEIRLSDELWMELRTSNVGVQPQKIGAALHSYYAVSDCSSVEVPQLRNLHYLDKTKGYEGYEQQSGLLVPASHRDAEIDRVYLNAPSAFELVDRERNRNVAVCSWGNESLVVWNPGAAVAKTMADFTDAQYRNMVCLEPAALLDSCVTVNPGQNYSIGQVLSGANS